MANQYHLSLLQQGTSQWNQWRSQSPEIQPDLSGALLSDSDLSGANLSEANLKEAILRGASLRGVTFWQASLRGADLHQADLRQAHLYQADLRQTDLSESDLSQANFREALLDRTIFANVDLSTVKGLETIQHMGRSYIDIHTLSRSQGHIPDNFLRGIGSPEHFITYMHSLPGAPVPSLSCFISASSHDSAFVSRLYADLQSQGIRCWLVFHDLNNGDGEFKHLTEAIQMHDTWLLALSEYTLISKWIKREVRMTMNLERQQNRTILFPLCIDQDFLDLTSNGIMLQNRQVRNFTHWQDPTVYQQTFTELLHDLKRTS